MTPDILSTATSLHLNNANEAETRKKVIDNILEHVLGWDPISDTTYEERVSEDKTTTYADYHLRTANTGVVVEAKRIGKTFSFPPEKSKKIKVKKLLRDKDLAEHIQQARDYCRKLSVSFAVVTNGAQWIIFPGSRVDGVAWEDSDAVVFNSLEEVLGIDRQEFLDLLSRDSVISGALERELYGTHENQGNSRKLRSYYHNIVNRIKNPIWDLVSDAIEAAFSDSIAEQDATLLEKCYVKTADRTRFDSKLNMQISRRTSVFQKSPTRPMKSADDGRVEKIIQLAKPTRPLAMVVLGPVGSGKTTFLQYARRISLRHYFEDRALALPPLWLNVDFRDFDESSNSSDFIYSRFFEFIQENSHIFSLERVIRASYKNEIDALSAGPLKLVAQNQDLMNAKISELMMKDYNEKHPYVDKLLKYYTQKSPAFLVIDNIDQLENEDFQSELFKLSIAFSRRLGLNLIITMRETTYVKHKSSPAFDAFDFNPVQIEPPDVKAVLSRRFAYAHELLAGRSGSFISANGANFHVENLAVFVEVVQMSVLGTEIGNVIASLSTGDIRLALRMTRLFLESGYTDPARAISQHGMGRPIPMPRHEALRAIILSGQTVYSEKASNIANPFDAMLRRNAVQMLRCYILNALVLMAADATFESVPVEHLVDICKSLGFSRDDSFPVIKDLAKSRYIQTVAFDEPTNASLVFPTRLGGIVLNDLMTELAFLECVMMDTFISDDASWEALYNLSYRIDRERDSLSRISLRIERARAYYDFLSSQFEPLRAEAIRRNLEPNWRNNPFERNRQNFEQNMDRVYRSAESGYHAAKARYMDQQRQ